MLSMLLAYDSAGNVLGTLDYLVARDEAGNVLGLIDFGAHEEARGKLRDIWEVAGAAGSATWPEWLGGQAQEFRVELEPGGKRIAALVHRGSGHRRERAGVEGAIRERIAAAEGRPADIRDLVGGPDRPLVVDEEGRTRARGQQARRGTPRHLPVVGPREEE